MGQERNTDPGLPESGDTTLADATGPRRRTAAPLRQGDRVGRYQLLGVVGRGGMGTVYSAYDPELDRRIALKLTDEFVEKRSGDDHRHQVLREAQAMARLNHPSVVTIHDVGEYEGMVFIAMEFVDGQTLGRWSEKHDSDEVLRACIEAGHGLIAAHDRGLIHRDFKPENVMVGRDGRVRVMDFGLARERLDFADLELGVDVSSGSGSVSLEPGDRTRAGALAGSPFYMAPEQYLKQTLTPASDQFSFCVTMFECLFGHRPFPGTSILRVAQRICAGDMDPPRAPGLVSDWILDCILRGLSTDPDERWPSMEDLVDALERDPTRDRARRRWRWGLGLGAAGIAGVIAWASTAEPQHSRCDEVAGQLDSTWNRQTEDAIAAAFEELRAGSGDDVAQVTSELDDYAQRWSTQARRVCQTQESEDAPHADVRQTCLDRAFDAFGLVVETMLAPTDEVRARALQLSSSLPDPDQCWDAADFAYRFELPPPDHLEAYERALSNIQLAELEFDLSRFERSRTLVDEAASEAESFDHRGLAMRIHLLRGRIGAETGQKRVAETEVSEAYFLAREVRDSRAAADAAIDLALVVASSRDRSRALTWARLALAECGEGPKWEDRRARAIGVRGRVLLTLDEYEEAEEHLREALRRLGELDEPLAEARATYLTDLSLALRGMERTSEARDAASEALALWSDLYGDRHPSVAGVKINLATLAYEDGDFATALSLLDEALSVTRERLGPEAIDVAGILYNRLMVEIAAGLPASVPHAREAARVARQAADERHPLRWMTQEMLSRQLLEQGDDEAHEHAKRALELYEAAVEPDPNKRARLIMLVAQCRLAAGQPSRAQALLEPLSVEAELDEHHRQQLKFWRGAATAARPETFAEGRDTMAAAVHELQRSPEGLPDDLEHYWSRHSNRPTPPK